MKDRAYAKGTPPRKKIKAHRSWNCPEIRTLLTEVQIDLIVEELPSYIKANNPQMKEKQISDLCTFYATRANLKGKTIAVAAITIGERIGSREAKDLWAWWMLLILFPDKYIPKYD